MKNYGGLNHLCFFKQKQVTEYGQRQSVSQGKLKHKIEKISRSQIMEVLVIYAMEFYFGTSGYSSIFKIHLLIKINLLLVKMFQKYY